MIINLLDNELLVSFSNRFLPFRIACQSIEEQPFHIHDGIELIYVLEGEIEIRVSQHCYTLKQGSFLLLNSYEVHRIENNFRHNIVLSLEIDNQYFDVEKDTLFHFDPFFYNSYDDDKAYVVKSSLADIYRLYIEDDKSNNDHILNQIETLLEFLRNNFQMYFYLSFPNQINTYNDKKLHSERIKRILIYLYAHCDEKVTLDTLAHIEYVNKYYISRLIKIGLGYNFQKIIQMIRVDRAELLILGTNLPISEICDKIGFASYKYFSSCYKESYGLSPSKYREKYGKETIKSKHLKYKELKYGLDEVNAILDKLHPKREKNRVMNYGVPADHTDRKIIKAMAAYDYQKERTMILTHNPCNDIIEVEFNIARQSSKTAYTESNVRLREYRLQVKDMSFDRISKMDEPSEFNTELIIAEIISELSFRAVMKPGEAKLFILNGQWYLYI